MEDMQQEVKRTHAKYVDMRQFAYLQIEALVKQLNAAKRGHTIQNSQMNVVKQLADKERKHWTEER